MIKTCKICLQPIKLRSIILPCCGFSICLEHFNSVLNCDFCQTRQNEKTILNLLRNRIEIYEQKIESKSTQAIFLMEKIKQIIEKPSEFARKISQSWPIAHEEALNWTLKELEIFDLNEAQEKVTLLFNDTKQLADSKIELNEYSKFLKRRCTIYDCIIDYLDLEKRLVEFIKLDHGKKWRSMKISKQFKLENLNFTIIEFIQSRKLILLSGIDPNIWIFDIAKFDFVNKLQGHKDKVLSIIYLNEDLVASGSIDRTIKIWNLEKNRCIYTLCGHQGDVTCLVRINYFVFVSGSTDTTIRFWKTENGEFIRAIKAHSDTVVCLENYAKGEVISASNDGTIKLWSKQNNFDKCIFTINSMEASIVSVKKLSESMFISASKNGVISVWDRKNGNIIKVYGCNEIIKCVTVGYSDQFCILGLENGNFQIIDMQTNQCIKEIKAHSSQVNCFCCCLNPGSLVSVSIDSIKFWISSN